MSIMVVLGLFLPVLHASSTIYFMIWGGAVVLVILCFLIFESYVNWASI